MSRLSQISLIAVPTISTPASTCATIEEVCRVSANWGVPYSGLRARKQGEHHRQGGQRDQYPGDDPRRRAEGVRGVAHQFGPAREHEEEIKDAGGDRERRVPQRGNPASHTPP